MRSKPGPVDLLVDALATYRLTRLLTVDRIAQPYRDNLAELGPEAAYFSTCPWCTSIWVGLGVVAARQLAPRTWAPLSRALAFSAFAGIVAEST